MVQGVKVVSIYKGLNCRLIRLHSGYLNDIHIACMLFFPQTRTVNEVTAALDQIQSKLDHCIPLAQRLNSLLPEDQRLERLQPVRLPPTRSPRVSVMEEEELGEEGMRQFDVRPWVGGGRRASRGTDEGGELPFQ